ncbi:MAG: PEP/pyruvate-binding domain-containing protein [Desulfatiglandales bacterium]
MIMKESDFQTEKIPNDALARLEAKGLQEKYLFFRKLLASNNRALEMLSDLEQIIYKNEPFSFAYVLMQTELLMGETFYIVENVNALSRVKYPKLVCSAEKISESVFAELRRKRRFEEASLVMPFERLSLENIGDVGGKAANLGEIYNRANSPVPQGFAVTAYACQQFLDHNHLTERIEEKLRNLNVNNAESLMPVSDEIRSSILKADVPPELESAIIGEVYALKQRIGRDLCLSVRSSATSEDTEASFAGQYSTLLNVREQDLIEAYKEVVSSTFNPRAIFYRRRRGFLDQDVVMSVAYVRMIDAKVSGVMYTVDPNDGRHAVIMISAGWGLGTSIVEGTSPADFFQIEKKSGKIEVSQCVAKKIQITTDSTGGVERTPVPKDLQNRLCLEESEVRLLTDHGLRLERHYGYALDIEWAIDRDGKLFILQARPLKRTVKYVKIGPEELEEASTAYPVILEGGVSASDGVACGIAHLVMDARGIHRVPEGAVVIAPHTSPRLVSLMGRIRAIVTDVGSVTGHMASVAREFQIPALVGTGTSTVTIRNGEEITVDATNRVVYRGRVEALMKGQRSVNPMKGSPIEKTVQAALKRVIPLTLTDPKKENFRPEACRTIHDLIRFSHEMAMQEMFRIGEDLDCEKTVAVPLWTHLPMRILIVDLGEGVSLPPGAEEARFENITSVPFRALITGMDLRGVAWVQEPSGKSEGRGRLEPASQMAANYAIIGSNYLNFDARLGYYFATLDTYCGPRVNDNYINFHFKGGAADIGRRSRRARFVFMVIREMGFSSEQKGDLVRGTFKKYLSRTLEEKIDMLGRLLGSVNFLDSTDFDEEPVEWYVDQFFERNYTFQK